VGTDENRKMISKTQIKQQLGQNLRILRDRDGHTQMQLAQIISENEDPDKIRAIARNIGSYEEGRAFPQPDMMLQILEHFGLDFQTMVKTDFSRLKEPELTAFLRSRPQRLQILAVPVDHEGREKIAMVEQKAAAGYVKGFSDREYIKELESFNLPWLPTGATYRAFEISGDSMPPIQPGSVVLGKFIEREEIKPGERYIIVTKEGVVFKRVYHSPGEGGRNSLLLTSDNPFFVPYEIPYQDILEVWQFYAHIAMSQSK
jgi:transcriptional regulator with XRE-family HTH domain